MNRRRHTIGIITPSLNQGRFIGAAIDSVVRQTRRVDYYAIYDAESTDSTREELVKARSKVSYVRVARDGGQADALHTAFNEMPQSIDIMGYLNADDALERTAVEVVMDVFETRPDVDIVTGWRQIIGPRGRRGLVWRSFPRSLSDFLISPGIWQECTFWRRSAYIRAGARIDRSYKFAMDVDLWVRMLEAGCSLHHVPRVLGYFRVHAGSKTETVLATTGYSELNRIRAVRGLPSLSRNDFRKHSGAMRRAALGVWGSILWRVLNQVQKRVLLKIWL